MFSLPLQRQHSTALNRSVLVIGTTGSGKSTFGNFLLGEKKFKVCTGGFSSVTTHTEAHVARLKDRQLYVVDTPGFSDTRRSDDDILQEISSAVALARDGAHAIFICVKSGERFGKAEQHALEQMEKLGDFWKHARVVFTNAGAYGDTEEEQIKGLKEALEGSPMELKWLVKRTQGTEQSQDQYILVESVNSMEHGYQERKLKEIIEAIDAAFSRAERVVYTNDLFHFAQTKYEELKKKSETESEAIIQSPPPAKRRRGKEERKSLEASDAAQLERELANQVQAQIKTTPLWQTVLGLVLEVAKPVIVKRTQKFLESSRCSVM